MDWNAWAIIAGFIGGAIISVIATLLIVKGQRQRKELSYRIEVRPFIIPGVPGRAGARWDPNVKVFYGDKEVSQLFPFKVTFRNTGNQTLEELPIKLEPSVGAKILNLIVGHSKDVEVGDIHYRLTKPEEWGVQVGFLNEGDEIEAHGIGTSNDKFELTIKVQQPGVRPRNRPEFWTSREALGWVLKILAEMYPFPFALLTRGKRSTKLHGGEK